MTRVKIVGRAVLALLLAGSLAGCASGGIDDPAGQEGPGQSAARQSGLSASAEKQDQDLAGNTVSAPNGKERAVFFIYANGQKLEVAPSSNSSSEALIKLLEKGDLMVDAHDYGNFEKVGSLPQSLPTNDKQITTEPGDVILYQGDQITVYYDTNSWNFTRLGKIQGVSASDLRQILGNGSVELRLSLQ